MKKWGRVLPVLSTGTDGSIIVRRLEKQQYKDIIALIKENDGIQLGQGKDLAR